MNELLNTPLFGILVSLIAFELGVFISKKFKWSIFNPLLIANVLVIGFLLTTGISLETYNLGGDYISFFLSPATAVLAVPLYKQLPQLKKNIVPILAGITAGCIVSVVFIILFAKLVHLNQALWISLVPKSITTPMGIELSKEIGGIPAVTIIAIVVTGITGAVVAPIVCKLFHIKDSVAQGLAIGTSSHAVGTARAMEMGETQGAMSSLAIGVAGIITAILAPLILKFIQ
ncbi:MAG: LrgB family protein [Fibrobacteraceae bacterium]|nr:LrgB family protein [Fibrobacteraceae bacterium]